MKPILLVATVLAVAGCVHTTPIPTNGGGRAFLIECNGAVYSIGACFKEAAIQCPNGYALLDRQTEISPPMAFSTSNAASSAQAQSQWENDKGKSSYSAMGYANSQAVYVQGIDRNIMVRCNP